jgi:hypothetical protein
MSSPKDRVRQPLVAVACVLAIGAVGVLPGCSSGEVVHDDDEGAEVDESNLSTLRGATVLQGSIEAGSTRTLHYDRNDAVYPRRIPYLALEIVAQRAAPGAVTPSPVYTASVRPLGGETGAAVGPDIDALQSVAVSGDFPGTPRVLVVDEGFRIVARTTAVTQLDGTEVATLAVPRSAGKRFVLIRDGRWSRPMDFQVRVGP